ncbi:MAG: hypothetical protein HQL22_11710 [Candidatus Omnitrophica bacterium]|nr:hypothetical protein [Candidatus Omnitrophota bacterium]
MPSSSSTFNFKQLPQAFLIFLAVIVALDLLDLFVLPLNTFTFRVWESLSVHTYTADFPGPFYPNQNISMTEVGDLAPHSPLAVKKQVQWQTDRFGYRDRDDPINDYDIVIVGDSFTAGTSLTQADCLTEVLQKKLGLHIYGYATRTVKQFLEDERFKNHYPKVVIWEISERSLGRWPIVEETSPPTKNSLPFNSIFQIWDSKYWLRSRIDHHSKKAWIGYCVSTGAQLTASLSQALENFFKRSNSKSPSDILFSGQPLTTGSLTEKNLHDIVTSLILPLNQELNKKHIQLILLPIPDKLTIYAGKHPSKNGSDFLNRLTPILKQQNVNVVDVKKAFDNAYQKNNIYPYQPDDSHWNPDGIKITAELIARELAEIEPKTPKK